MQTKIHTPSPFGLGILAGLEDRGTYDNPFDSYGFEKHEHQRWDEGCDVGAKLRALVIDETAAEREP